MIFVMTPTRVGCANGSTGGAPMKSAPILASVASGSVSGDPILLRRLERKLGLVELRAANRRYLRMLVGTGSHAIEPPQPLQRKKSVRDLQDPNTITRLSCARSVSGTARASSQPLKTGYSDIS